jgi:predicted dehydrogenase
MLNRKPRLLLVGICGYGGIYLEEILRGCAEGRIELAGTVDPRPEGCRYLKELADMRVPHFPDLDGFFGSGSADLVVVSTPIQFHEEHTCRALAAGASVLCEKPVAATVEQALRMKAAEARAEGFVAIGYQWSFAGPIQALKRDVMAGALGPPLRLKTLISWPRPESYYARNDWAGRIALPGGQRVLDSPANNAMAHYLHNMLYLLGDTRQASALPAEVSAELYRANDIENYDTVALRCLTSRGVPLFFYATHAGARNQGPMLEYEFENGTVRLAAEQGNHLTLTGRDGRVHDYGEIPEYPDRGYFKKLWDSVAALARGPAVACTIESATPHVVCVNAAQRPRQEIPSFPPECVTRIETPQGPLRAVAGLQEALERCYREWSLPAETGEYSWARPAVSVNLRRAAGRTGGQTGEV